MGIIKQVIRTITQGAEGTAAAENGKGRDQLKIVPTVTSAGMIKLF